MYIPILEGTLVDGASGLVFSWRIRPHCMYYKYIHLYIYKFTWPRRKSPASKHLHHLFPLKALCAAPCAPFHSHTKHIYTLSKTRISSRKAMAGKKGDSKAKTGKGSKVNDEKAGGSRPKRKGGHSIHVRHILVSISTLRIFPFSSLQTRASRTYPHLPAYPLTVYASTI